MGSWNQRLRKGGPNASAPESLAVRIAGPLVRVGGTGEVGRAPLRFSAVPFKKIIFAVKRYVYMNHRIREKRPSGPVIVVQSGERFRRLNCVQLVHDGMVVGELRFRPGGLKGARHHVRVALEVPSGVSVRCR